MITIYLTNSPVITIYWTNDYTLLSNDNDIGKIGEKHKNTHICRILPKLQHTRFIGQLWLEKMLLPDNFFSSAALIMMMNKS